MTISDTSDFPIKHEGNVHSGKVRSVYWLSDKDSRNVMKKLYGVDTGANLGVMIISDRISAFDVNWKGEDGLSGVPGKGAALNAISQYWFNNMALLGIGGNHIHTSPHPLVWIVEKAEPVMVEAIARQYITGSMWRDYREGVREFCGIMLPEGLIANQKLADLLITPTTKGILKGIPGVPEADDVNISRKQIEDNYKAFGFKKIADIDRYELMLKNGFDYISRTLDQDGQIFVDTKFEFGYVSGKLIFIDEIGTPDSSRMWDKEAYNSGRVVENSKEGFRKFLLDKFGDTKEDVLLNKAKMSERKELARDYRVPVEQFMETSKTYSDMAERITGKPLPQIENAREEIMEALSSYGLLK